MRSRPWPINSILISVWALGLAAHLCFSWDLGRVSVTVGILLVVLPLIAWFLFGGYLPQASWPNRVGLFSVLLLYVAAILWLPVGAHSYIWRHEAYLLRQAEAALRGAAVDRALGFEVRIDEKSGRVYWPRVATALSSGGLVYDPTGRIRDVPRNSPLFGESVLSVQHLRGPWYIVGLS